MAQRRAWSFLLCAAALVALAVTAARSLPWGPPIESSLHAAIGAALAQEAVRCTGAGSRCAVISRDPESFPQPAVAALLRSFHREAAKLRLTVDEPRWVQTDPIRPVEVPSGDFFEAIRRSTPDQVIVSLLGPPLLTPEQRSTLPELKGKIVAFCPGALAARVDLDRLFSAGLLHAAIVDRFAAGPGPGAGSKPGPEFAQRYEIVRSSSAAPRPANGKGSP